MTHHTITRGEPDTCEGCGVETADNTGWDGTYDVDPAWEVRPVHFCPPCGALDQAA